MFKTLTDQALEDRIDAAAETLERDRNDATAAHEMGLLLQELEDRRIIACHGHR